MPRWIVALAGVAVVASTAITPGTAVAQLDVEDLEEDEADLLAEQQQLDEEVLAAARVVADTQDRSAQIQVEVTLLVRDQAAAQERYDESNGLRRSIAIQRYVLGDPRLEGFIDELIQERASIEPGIERALYQQVIDGNTAEVDGFDAAIEGIADEIDARDDELEDLQNALPEQQARYDELVAAKEATDSQLADIQAELDWERSLLRRARLTGHDDGTDNNRPVLAVKIDNVAAARPQAGINQADVVIEELVEGDLTRLVGLFHSTDSNPIGPIRSVRTSDVFILANLNRPLLANSGGNPGVMQALNESPIVDVGASVAGGGIYFRDGSRRAPNNLFSNTSDLWALGAGSGAGAAPAVFSFRRPDRPLAATSQPMSGVTIDYGATQVTYRWDPAVSGWRRTQDGSPHVDASGVQVAPTNVIVQFVPYRPSPVAAISPEAQVEGEGIVWVFEDGNVQFGSWSRPTLESPTRYLDADGEEIELLPGTTWIALAVPDTARFFE